jgi:hypothetical protein
MFEAFGGGVDDHEVPLLEREVPATSGPLQQEAWRLNATSVTKNSQNDARPSDECRLLYMSGKRDSSR